MSMKKKKKAWNSLSLIYFVIFTPHKKNKKLNLFFRPQVWLRSFSWSPRPGPRCRRRESPGAAVRTVASDSEQKWHRSVTCAIFSSPVRLCCAFSAGKAAEFFTSDGRGQPEAEGADGGGSCWTLWYRACGWSSAGDRDGGWSAPLLPNVM